MHHISLVLLSLLSLTSCSDKDEKWCDQLVLDACACEAEEESDLCQDAEVVANNGDDESCEDYYFDALPTSCQNHSDDWSGSSSGSSNMSACEQLVVEYCACDGVDEDMCAEYSAAVAGSNGDETVCQSYLDAGVCP